jgi:hypothetical protein
MGIRSTSKSMSKSKSTSRTGDRKLLSQTARRSAPIAHDLENESLPRCAVLRPIVDLAIKSFVIRKCIAPQELLQFARRAQKDRHS